MSPAKHSVTVENAMTSHCISEKRACRVLGANRSSYRYDVKRLPYEDDVRARIIELACNFGRTGYRQVRRLLRNEGMLFEWTLLVDVYNNEFFAHSFTNRRGSNLPYYRCLDVLKQKVGLKNE